MARDYYFLVAGLPDLLLDEQRQTVSFCDFVSDVKGWIDLEDAALIRFFQYPSDNKNLIRLLTKSSAPFDPNGIFSEEELAQAVKTGDEMPDYMAAFMAAQRESRPMFEGRSLQDTLAWLFYDEVTEHQNEFVREWFTADLHIRNVIAALNCRYIARQKGQADPQALIARAVVCHNEVSDALCRGSAVDFGLSGKLPWFERVLGLETVGMLERERRLDDVRWSILDDLTILSGFRIEAILAFIAKLSIAERWRDREAGRGKAMLEQMVSELSRGGMHEHSR
jgi:hypothetical protein